MSKVFYRNKGFTRRKTASGFTLIEVLVVIMIIGVLAAGLLALINPGAQMAKARNAERKSDLRQIATALELYNNDHGEYPPTGGIENNCTYVNSDWGTAKPYSGEDGYIPGLAPDYIAVLPGDPNVNGKEARCYVYFTDGAKYVLWAHEGYEGTAAPDPNDKMIRLTNCADPTSVHPTFVITSTGTRCWPWP